MILQLTESAKDLDCKEPFFMKIAGEKLQYINGVLKIKVRLIGRATDHNIVRKIVLWMLWKKGVV